MALALRALRWLCVSLLVVVPLAGVDNRVCGKGEEGAAPTSQELDAFHAWFQERGGHMHGIALAHFASNGGDVGILATTSVTEGDHVLQVPLSIVMYV